MKLLVIDFEVPCSATAETAFDVLRDSAGWPSWSAARHASLEREGSPTPDGVGAIRRFRTGPFGSREEVVAFDPPTHFAYLLLEGIPVRDYRADVTITPTQSGCTIAWHSTFHRKFPGWGAATRVVLKLFLRDNARRLARFAERRS